MLIEIRGNFSQSLPSDDRHRRREPQIARMPASDFEIQRLAHLFIQLDGERATAKARKMVEEMRHKGDHEGADTWLRIIVAIGKLGEPPTVARH